MNLFITGVNGALGWNLAQFFHSIGNRISGSFHLSPPPFPAPKLERDFIRLNLEDPSCAQRQLESIPEETDAIIHCAALTDVNYCQENPELARIINDKGTELVVSAARQRNAALVYISTDFVFPGSHEYYLENSPPNPAGIYGQTKLSGEISTLTYERGAVIRFTPLDHPYHLSHHSNTLVRWMESTPAGGPALKLFSDKTFSPVSAREVFEICEKILIELEAGNGGSGIWHACSQEILSVYETGVLIRDHFKLSTNLVPSTFPDNEYGRIRPRHSGLKSTRHPSRSIMQILSELRE